MNDEATYKVQKNVIAFTQFCKLSIVSYYYAALLLTFCYKLKEMNCYKLRITDAIFNIWQYFYFI